MVRIRYLIFFWLIFVSCKIEIESPYEDAVGISFELLETHSVSGSKLVFFGDTIITQDGEGIEFYDIRLPYERVNYYHFFKIINDFILHNKNLIIALSDSMIKVLNISNPSNLYVIDSLKLGSGCKSLMLKENNVFAISDSVIFIIDCTDLNNLNVVKTLQFENEIINSVIYSDKLYANLGKRCRIFDVKNSSNPYQSDSIIFEATSKVIAINKDYLYSYSTIFNEEFRYDDYYIYSYNMNNKQKEDVLALSEPLISITVFDKLGIAISSRRGAYLLNLEFPSRPAMLEMIEYGGYGGVQYGMIRDQKVYLLTWDGLKVFLIKKTD